MTKDDKYKPTAAEARLLEVLVNPENVGKNVTEVCNLANISRDKYYKSMKKSDFRECVNNTTLDLVKGKISDVLNAAYTYALTEKGFQDRKMLLTLAGIYSDKVETSVTGNMNVNKPLAGITTDEIKSYLGKKKLVDDG